MGNLGYWYNWQFGGIDVLQLQKRVWEIVEENSSWLECLVLCGEKEWILWSFADINLKLIMNIYLAIIFCKNTCKMVIFI